MGHIIMSHCSNCFDTNVQVAEKYRDCKKVNINKLRNTEYLYTCSRNKTVEKISRVRRKQRKKDEDI